MLSKVWKAIITDRMNDHDREETIDLTWPDLTFAGRYGSEAPAAREGADRGDHHQHPHGQQSQGPYRPGGQAEGGAQAVPQELPRQSLPGQGSNLSSTQQHPS